MTPTLDPDLDLTINRIIKAPRAAVWRAWTDAASFEQWWLPAPHKCKVAKMELRAGGAFETLMSENGGPFQPHVTASFLAVEERKRIVFTDALTGGWRPAARPFITAIITLRDHSQGTDYAALVLHRSKPERDRHEKMGFYDGWGTVIEQLARLVEKRA